MFGGQDGTYYRSGPQPLGMFSEARVYPNPGWHGHDVIENVLECSRSGVLIGLVDTVIDVLEAASIASSSSDTTDSDEYEIWAEGVRLARFAV